VKEFVERTHGFIPKPPVYVKEIDSVEAVLLKVSYHNVHRVYIVNNLMQPIGVLTLSDLLQFFASETIE